MNNRGKTAIFAAGICLIFISFFGCGEQNGEREFSKAQKAWAAGDYVRAQNLLEKSIREIPGGEKKAEAYNQLGLVLWKLDKPKLAIKAFDASCRTSKYLTGANANLGTVLLFDGQIDPAEFELTKVQNANPDNALVNTFMGMVNIQKQDWKGASEVLSSAMRDNQSDPALANALAVSELHQGRGSSAAVARLKRIQTSHPEYAPALYNLAAIHEYWLKSPKEALSYYKAYAQLESADETLAKAAVTRLEQPAAGAASQHSSNAALASRHLSLATSYHQKKQYAQAIQEYSKTVNYDPSHSSAYYNMGMAYYSLKKYPEARKAYQSTLNLDPAHSKARYNIALCYYQERKFNESEKQAKLLLSTDPNHTKAKELLGFIKAARRR